MLIHLWHRLRAAFAGRRVIRERERFWAEVHAGEREAEARTRARADLALRAREPEVRP